MSITPTEATTLASGGDERSGRNTRKWSANPSSAATTNERANAGQNAIGPPRLMKVGQSGKSQFGVAHGTAEPLDEGQRVGKRQHDEITGQAQLGERVGDVHRHRPMGEVDDAGRAVGEDETLRERAVQGAGSEPEQRNDDVAIHSTSPLTVVIQRSGTARSPLAKLTER